MPTKIAIFWNFSIDFLKYCYCHFIFEMELSINVSTVAYCKINLHAIKYPHCPVKGILIGQRKSEIIEIVDAIPALHSAMLAPTIEILFIHLDAYCQEKGMEIVGQYFGNQLLENNGLDEPWLKVAAEKLSNSALILQIDNSKLSLTAADPCLRAYAQESLSKWSEVNFILENSDDSVALTSIAIQKKWHRSLADFENHLDEPLVADFYNVEINDRILSTTDI